MSKAFIVGGGIASLASAAYLVRDGRIPGSNITIFEETTLAGGSLDGQGSPETGYVIRGGRMFNLEAYTATYRLLSFIPSLSSPATTVRDELREFNHRVKSCSHSRLLDHGEKVDASTMGFSNRDRLDLVHIMARSEASLGTLEIQDCFAPSFFETNFWYMWATMFAFQPWHSAVEFKRYVHRFLHEFPRIDTLAGVERTPYNQYESVVLPITKWLREQGVRFEMGTQVTDLDFKLTRHGKAVERIHCVVDGKARAIPVEDDDYVFVTIGSMTAGSSVGSMTSAPTLNDKTAGGSWALWEAIAKNGPEFGRPSVFADHVDESKWLSFTCTFREPTFFQLMEIFTDNVAGTGGLVTFKDSSWLMSIVLAHQPHFLNQPPDINVCWGYGLFPDEKGDYVKKKMSECTGEELLVELFSQLNFTEHLPSALRTTTCLPSMMPFITSQFLPRRQGDRPLVRPKGTANIAFIGQFCEIPDDVVFTVEYSVRSAQTAVYSLLGLNKPVAPLYKGERDPKVLYRAAQALFR